MVTMWWNPFTVERVTLRSPHTPDECRAGIRANIYTLWHGVDPALPFNGRVRRNHFALCKNTPGLRSAFRPIAYGAVRADSVQGTVISIRLAMGLLTRIWWTVLLMSFAVAFLLSFLGATGILVLDPTLSDPFIVLLAAVIAGAMFYPFYLIMFWLTRRERGFLVDSLHTILDASVIR